MLPPQLVRVIDQHDGVVHHDADQYDHPEEALHVERRARDHQHGDHADRRERNREQDDERVAQRLELRRHHHVDQHQRQNGGERQFAERLLLVLPFASEPDLVAVRDGDAGHLHAQVPDDAAQIPVRDRAGNVQDALLVHPADLHRAFLAVQPDHVVGVDQLAARRPQRDAPHLRQFQPVFLPQPDDDVVLVALFPIERGAAAADRSFQGVGHLLNGHAHARGLEAVDANHHLGRSGLSADLGLRHARHRQHGVAHPQGDFVGRFGRIAADRNLQAVIGPAPAAAPPSEIAARDPRAQLHAGGHGHEHGPQHVGDLAGRTIALRLIDERDSQLADMRGDGAERAVAARLGHDVVRLGNPFHDDRLHAVDDLLGHFSPRAGLEFEIDPDLALVDLRLELDADESGQPDRTAEQGYGSRGHHDAIPQRPADPVGITRRKALHRLFGVLHDPHSAPAAPDVARAQGRHHRQRDRQRTQQRKTDHVRQLLERLRGVPADEHHGNEDCDGRQRRRADRHGHLAASGQGRLAGFQSLLAVAVDVLQNDDRVVDEHADAQGQAAERDGIQREAVEVHQGERRDHRNGDRGSDDEGARQAAEEHEQDEHGQQAPYGGGGLDVPDRGVDEIRRVHRLVDRDVRVVGVDLRHFGPDGFRHLDRVGAGLLEHDQPQGGGAVDAHVMPHVRVRILDLRDVPDIDRHAVPRGQGHVENLLDVVELAAGAQENFEAALPDGTYRTVQVLAPDRVHDFRDGQVEGAQFLQVQVDMDLPPQAAADPDLADALDALEAVQDAFLGECPQLPRPHVRRRHREEHDGELGHIELEDGRRLDIVRQGAAPPIQSGTDFVGGHIDIGAVDELDPYGGTAFARGG